MQIVRVATRGGTELLGLQDRIGTLESGRLDEIIAVPGDPGKDVKALARAKFVRKGGTIFKDAK